MALVFRCNKHLVDGGGHIEPLSLYAIYYLVSTSSLRFILAKSEILGGQNRGCPGLDINPGTCFCSAGTLVVFGGKEAIECGILD